MYKPLIVGIDPGTTVGIAIFDFKGNVISTITKRHLSKNDIARHISQFGKPTVIASDVHPMPSMVRSIASMTSSKTFSPGKSLSTHEKNRLVRKFGKELKDIHIKDAFAAAYKAFKTYRSLLNKVETNLESSEMGSLYESVVDSLIRKHSYNIKEAIEKCKPS